MMEAVGKALNEAPAGRAGTGTGKSLAYLLPRSAMPPRTAGAVISTNTVSLQDQLYHRTSPCRCLLQFRAALLKGTEVPLFAPMCPFRSSNLAPCEILPSQNPGVVVCPPGNRRQIKLSLSATDSALRSRCRSGRFLHPPAARTAGVPARHRARRARSAHYRDKSRALLTDAGIQGFPEYSHLIVDRSSSRAEATELAGSC